LTIILSVELAFSLVAESKTRPERSTICPGEYFSLPVCIFSSRCFEDIGLSCGTKMLIGFDLQLEEASADHIPIEKLAIMISMMLIIIYDLYFLMVLEYQFQSSFALVKAPHL
jgi:hypothetical protein